MVRAALLLQYPKGARPSSKAKNFPHRRYTNAKLFAGTIIE